MIREETHSSAEGTGSTGTEASTVGHSLSREQARVELVESFLNGRDECHVAIRNRPGFLGLNRLLGGRFHSWVHIERSDNGTFDLMWTSSRDTHQPLSGPAFSVGIDSGGEVISMYKSAITMWMEYHHRHKPDVDRRERAETVANRLFGFMRIRGEAEA